MKPTFNFINPNYDSVFAERAVRLARLQAHPEEIGNLKAFYKENPVQFINDWGVTFDPRKDGKDKIIPFILFPRQAEFVNWVRKLWQSRKRGLGEKSREVGFTWLCVAIAVHMWLFEDDSITGFGSRKKELVDNGDDDPDSIFWKVRFFIDHLPREFLPRDYKLGRKSMVVPNRENGATIKGEIGDEIGRGGRSTIYFADEFAHLEHQDMAESALSQNTECRIYISTVNGVGNLFYKLRHFLPPEQIFIFDWTDDPRKRKNPGRPANEEPWYIDQKRNMLPTTLASQVDRDYNAAIANSFIETELITNAENTPITAIIQPNQTPWTIGVDASGMGNDETVIWRRRGRLNLEPITYSKIDGVILATEVERECKLLLKDGPIALIGIERDGPGGSCADQLAYGPFASVTQAVHTGAKLNNGKHYNLRAFLYDQVREYLMENQVHLPRNDTFRTQATAIQLAEPKGGMMLVESKADYRARFSIGRSKAEKSASKSPDHFDALMLTMIPVRGKPIKQLEAQFNPFQNGSGWRPLDKAMGY